MNRSPAPIPPYRQASLVHWPVLGARPSSQPRQTALDPLAAPDPGSQTQMPIYHFDSPLPTLTNSAPAHSFLPTDLVTTLNE